MKSPLDPFCNRTPAQIDEYVMDGKDPDEAAREDGTYNPFYNMFCCTACYISRGMPLNHTLEGSFALFNKEDQR